MGEDKKIYGARIGVLDVQTGEYKFSDVLNEPLQWPVLLLDDYRMISITEAYDLVTWKRTGS